MAQDLDAERERRQQARQVRHVRAVRRLLLDAVLTVEEADLRLEDMSVVTLREQLIQAAGKLTLAANGLTNPELLSEDDR